MPATATKPVLPPLQTPKTGSFPSEFVDTPLSACLSAVIKQEQGLKTPITPPTAYTEFLKALTPILASPPATALQRSLSDESTATRDSLTSNRSSTSSFSSNKGENHKSPTSLIPPTPFRRTPSHLKRLRIPHSPAYSTSTCGPSPRTAMSSIGSANMAYSPFSPADWSIDSATRKYFDAPRSACSKPVSVRSVVTRTVTYKRSPPLDPAPRGKKRKVESSEMPPPSTASSTPPTAVA